VLLESPRFIFIGRNALTHRPDCVAEALRMTPPVSVFVASDLDAKLAAGISEQVLGTGAPIAIVANFPFDFATINEGGEVVPKELPMPPSTE
jgi:hypothetical protein